jgi:hypothetical protein
MMTWRQGGRGAWYKWQGDRHEGLASQVGETIGRPDSSGLGGSAAVSGRSCIRSRQQQQHPHLAISPVLEGQPHRWVSNHLHEEGKGQGSGN